MKTNSQILSAFKIAGISNAGVHLMIALIVRRLQEIDTLNPLAISYQRKSISRLDLILVVFFSAPTRTSPQIHGSFWVRLASKTSFDWSNLCKIPSPSPCKDDRAFYSLMGIDKLLNSSFLCPKDRISRPLHQGTWFLR